ncbi:amino acid adenylation domain-containing protein, partial [Dactylosporangium fulvum]|uniref:amino acid adenylation domain-containing protein n=1 Tax=Dactylosporangium fulvum TaxID=53359 RepID=UPI0031D27A04
MPEPFACRTSPAQDRMWFFEQLVPGTSTYNLGGAIDVDGTLHERHLADALRDVVARHESLRTCFEATDDGARQLVFDTAAPDFECVDLTGHGPDAERVADELAAAELARPFDLEQLPLARFRLLRLAPRRHVLVSVFHHIVTDDWSLAIFTRELAACYAARCAAVPHRLPPLPLQYADYAAWQRDLFEQGAVEEQLRYWRERLDGAPVLALPTDRPRPAEESHRGAGVRLALDPALTDRLRQLSRGEGVTLFMTLLACFTVVLGRWAGQADVVVGMPIANRPRRELHDIVGLFVNLLALRTDLGGGPTLRQVLRRTAETCTAAFDRQDAPFDQVVAASGRDRDTGRHPLFQVLFQLLEDDLSGFSLHGAAARPRDDKGGSVKLDISCTVTDTGGGLTVDLQYATDLWDESTVRRMLDGWVRILRAMAARPDALADEVPLLSAEEYTETVERWNTTGSPFTGPDVPALDALFADQVRRRPDAIALSEADRRWSYADLDAASGRLAAALRAAGVRPDDPVGVLLDRSAALVVAMLGVVRSGGGYLVLDPAYPAARLAALAADAGIRAVVSAGPPGDLFEDVPHVDVTVAWAAGAPSTVDPIGGPDRLANIVYTSGSTGRPKGVAVTHRGIVRLVAGSDHAPVTASDVVLFTASPSFDTTTYVVWASLVNGAHLAVVPADRHLDAAAITAAVAGTGATVARLTPALFHLVADADPAAFRGLRCLDVGGDVVDPERARRVADAGAPAVFVNAYGPTEITVTAVAHRIGSAAGDTADVVPIGRPISGSTAYVVDRNQRPVPTGVVGELLVGGPGVARGYVGNPAATAERFVPDPFGGTPGGRLYRTGDLVRRRADGTLVFVGRADRQVKVRGHRIEPAEVEAAVLRLDGVAECAVTVTDHAGDRRLVAYVAPGGTAAPDGGTLRDELARRLPPYLVPAHVVVLERLPLTRTGKLDRAALAAALPGRVSATPRVLPRTDLERALHEVVAGLLGVGDLGVHDDFFANGGHSLLAATAVAAIRRRRGVAPTLREFFAGPTVAALAALLAGRPATEPALRYDGVSPDAVAPHERAGLRRLAWQRGIADLGATPPDPAPASGSQRAMLFLHRLDPPGTAYVTPVHCRVTGPLDEAALHAAYTAVVHRHEVLRTVLRLRDGAAVQVVAPPGPVPLPVTDLTGLDPARREAELHALAAAERRTPFDLAAGPPVRARLVRLGADDAALLVTFHHAVIDGWSVGLFAGELTGRYRAILAGDPAPGAAPPVPQHGEYARWQAEWLTGPQAQASLAYWRRQLDGLDPAPLPADRPGPVPVPLRAAVHRFTVPAADAARLEALARRHDGTLFTVLSAALHVLLAGWTGRAESVFGTQVANRPYEEVHGVIGFLANVVVLRAPVRPEQSFSAFLRDTTETCLAALEHQEVPFDVVVRHVAPPRTPGVNPLYRVAMTVHNTPEPEWTAGPLALRPLDADAPGEGARLELELDVRAGADGLACHLTYALDRFTPATAARLADAFGAVLRAVTDAADPAVAELLPIG